MMFGRLKNGAAREPDWVLILLCAGLLFIPTLRVFLIPGEDTGFLYFAANGHISLFQVLCVSTLILNGREDGVLLRPGNMALVCIALWLGVAVLTAFQATVPLHAWIKTDQYVIHLIFALALIPYFQSRQDVLKPLMLALICGFAFYSLVMVIRFQGLTALEMEQLSWNMPGFSNVRTLGFYAAVAVMIANGLLFCRRETIPRGGQALFILCLIWSWGLLLWTGSRGAVLSLCAAALIMVFFAKRSGYWRVLGVNLLAILLGAVAAFFVPVDHGSFGLQRFFIGTYADATVNQISSGRLEIWTEALSLWAQQPLLGYGSGQSRFLIEATQGVFAQPHNVVINAIFSWGLMGGIPYLLFMAMVILKPLIALRHMDGLTLAAFGGAFVLALNAAIDGSLYHAFPLLLFTCFMSAVWAQLRIFHNAHSMTV